MNGITSSKMREYGLHYKLNFGVPIHQIRKIATRYEKDTELAEKLWQDGTRELKILATLLYPAEGMDIETARRWIQEIPNQEIREQFSFNLLRFTPFELQLAVEFSNDPGEDNRKSGYCFFAKHLIGCNFKCDVNINSLKYLEEDIISEDVSLRNPARIFLKNFGRISKSTALEIIGYLEPFAGSDNSLKKEIYHVMLVDFDYYYGIDDEL